MWERKKSSRRDERLWDMYRQVPTGIRIWPFVSLALCVSLILLIRLLQLTVVEGEWRRDVADQNRIFRLRIPAQRGILSDRNGQPLTRNMPVYKRLKPGTTPAELQYEWVDREQALKYLSQAEESVSFDMARIYPCGRACAQAVGYMAEMSTTAFFEQPEYQLGDLVGKTGAEKEYERLLRGIAGEEYVEINARGEPLRNVGIKQSQQGKDIVLSIDTGLSQVLYEAFGDQVGAAVAIEPKTGELLAAVSVPSYDPEQVGTAFAEENQPFFNRALSGLYPPGSTFKMVSALAAMEEGKISVGTQFEDTGELVVGDYRYGNWLYDDQGRTEGSVNVVKALARSNDIFFYQAGGLVGPERLAEWAGVLGIGKSWGLSSWGEKASLVPTPDWKLTTRGERWYLGNTYHMAIGQGDVLTTPLSIAVMTSALANNGILCPPTFSHLEASPVCQQLGINSGVLQAIVTGMTEACQPGGTGGIFFEFSPAVACKTGTAQHGGEEDMPHAWFTVFAPALHPTIALTVLVEEGGQGSQVAAPIAKAAIEYWLQSQD